MPEAIPNQIAAEDKFLARDHGRGDPNPQAGRPRAPLKFEDFSGFAETIDRLPRPEAE